MKLQREAPEKNLTKRFCREFVAALDVATPSPSPTHFAFAISFIRLGWFRHDAIGRLIRERRYHSDSVGDGVGDGDGDGAGDTGHVADPFVFVMNMQSSPSSPSTSSAVRLLLVIVLFLVLKCVSH